MDAAKQCKHLLDRVTALLLLALSMPLWLVVLVAVRRQTRASCLWLEERVGHGGRSFSMFLLPPCAVTTLLRRMHLHRTPCLLNIALGEMSFVGPRPLGRAETVAAGPRTERRQRFRPGIVGLDRLQPRPWIEADLEYVERFSLLLDAQIVAHSVRWLLQAWLPMLQRAAPRRRRRARDLPAPVSARPLQSNSNAVDFGLPGIVEALPTMASVARRLDAAPAISALAVIAPDARIGAGARVLSGATIGAGSTLGRGTIVHNNVRVGSHCRIGDLVRLGPGSHLADGARIGARTHVGVGAVVDAGITVHHDALILGGAHVCADVAPHGCAAGRPARLLAPPAATAAPPVGPGALAPPGRRTAPAGT